MLARDTGGGGTIVVDIEGVRHTAAVLADGANAYQLLAGRLRGRALPVMPPGVAERVSLELSEVCCSLGSEPNPLLNAAQELGVRALWAEIADRLSAGYELQGTQLTEFKAAIASGALLRYSDPWQAQLATDYANKLHQREHPGGISGFFNNVGNGIGDFATGAWDSVKDPALMLYHLTPLANDWTTEWGNLGHGLAYGATHPLQFGKAIIGLDALQQRGLAYWLGNLAPTAAATILSGGAAGAVRGATTTEKVVEGTATADRLAAGAADASRLDHAGSELEAGMRVWRYHGYNEDVGGLRLVEGKTGADDGLSSVPSGSGPWGHSWTNVDPTGLANPRGPLGLPTGPDGNPARFLSEGVLHDTTGVTARRALPLDGNLGGWPEILVPNPERQIDLTRIYALNPTP